MADKGVVVDDEIDYRPFVEATKEGDWSVMKEFLHLHPGATKVSIDDFNRTALHYLFEYGNIEIGELLFNEMKRDEDLLIEDINGNTAFACLSSNESQPGVMKLLQRMYARSANLPNMGKHFSIPVIRASVKIGCKDTANYLYDITHEDVLNPDFGLAGIHLLVNCINIGLFDIASDMVRKFPRILRTHTQRNSDKICPIHALAKHFSTLKYRNMRHESRAFKLNHWLSRLWKCAKQYTERILGEYELIGASEDIDKLAYDKACTFLRLVCVHVSSFDESMLKTYGYEAMMEASKNGSIEFVSEMLIANPKLIKTWVGVKGFIPCAIENRQEKFYSVIHSFIEQKDNLLATGYIERQNNILHLVAKLPPDAAMGRMSSPAMAMQREILWFEEVWRMANPRYRDELNDMNLTPRDLFALEHKDLINEGERAMKETANSAAFVGALILTVSFAAAFTVPGGIKSDGLPLFLDRALFKIFVVCDALSLYSAIASILAILGILTSSFAEIDFLFKSPRRLMIGLATLWFSLLTMMLGFCIVLALMLDGLFRYILPITLLVLTPVILFMSPILPLCFEIYRSTYGTVLFEKNTKIRNRIEKNRKMRRGADDAKNLRAEENIISTNPSTADELV